MTPSGRARTVAEEDIAVPMFWEPSRYFLRFAIVGLVLGPATFLATIFTLMPDQKVRAIGPAIMILVALAAWWPLARGNVRACVLILTFGTWAAITGICVFNGGVRATVMIAYPLIIMISGWLLGTRTVITLAAMTVVVTLAFGLAELQGLLPAQPPTHPAMYWSVQIIIFVLSAVLLIYLARSYKSRIEEVQRLSLDLARRDADNQLSAALRRSAEMLDRTGRMARVGGWEFEPQSGKLIWTDETYRIFAFRPDQTPKVDEAIACFTPDARPVIEAAMRAATESGTPYDLELPLVTAEGQAIWVRAMAQAEVVDGKVVRLVGAVQDISAQIEANQKTKRGLDNLQRTLDATGDGIFGYDGRDPEGRLLFANDQFFKIWNIPLEDAPRTGRAEIIAASRKLFIDPDAEVRRIGEILALPEPHEDRVPLRDGRVLLRRSVPISGSDGVSRVWSFRDITLEARAVQALRESEKRLNEAQKLARLGSFDWNPVSGTLQWSDEHFRLWGYAPKAVAADYQLFRRGIHPDDLIRVEATLQQALRGGAWYECQHRVVWPDGSAHHVRGLGEVIFDANGKPIRMLGTVQDVSERVKAEQSLIAARDEAERANRAKSEFLATMSHEIRTPMNGVLGMTELLRATPLDATQQHYVESVHNSGRVLLGLLNDILDFSKIESGHMVIEAVDFDLAELLDATAALFVASARQKGLELRTEVEPAGQPIRVRGDPFRLRQVLSNLIGNAIKFTPDGHVLVQGKVMAESGDTCQLSLIVSDTGVGIAPEAHDLIFEHFTQADSSTTRRFGGSGLGLAICRQLVRLMGGEIRVDSLPGQGARFTVDLALPLASDAAREGRDVTPSEVQRAEEGLRGKVLLAEDNPINQEVTQVILAGMGLDVVVACNGEEALSLAAAQTFDLILMDCQMPVLDGFQATQTLRRREAGSTRRVPVVALTANALAGDRMACLAAGMDDYLAKPYTVPELRQVLGRWLQLTNGEAALTALAVPRQSGHADLSPATDRNALADGTMIDLTVLDQYRELDPAGGFGLARQIVRAYLDHSGRSFGEAERAMASRNAEALRRSAHKLKSSAANVGAHSLSRLLESLEAAAREGRMDEARGHFEAAGRAQAQVLFELDRLLTEVA